MALFKRKDSFCVNFVDSCADKSLKIKETRVNKKGEKTNKGQGEVRIYCGHDEKMLDNFFRFDLEPVFFLQKDDLEEFSKAIELEILNPQYQYGDGVKATYEIWNKNSERLKNLKEERLYFSYSKTYDKQNRYYIKLPRNKIVREKWSLLREILLPRVCRLEFLKLLDEETGKLFIYIKPIYGGVVSEGSTSHDITNKKLSDERGDKARKGQEKYREQVLNRFSYCVVTHVTDPNLLIACHIKDYAKCNQAEQYDKYNGLTMTPTIHSLFDLGYITFDETGTMILSDFFRNNDRRCLSLWGKTIRIEVTNEMKPYLQWHNEHTFIRTSRGVQIVGQDGDM